MKGAVELPGYIGGNGKEKAFILVPSGNHRNQQRVLVKPAAKNGQRCPFCKRALQLLVHTFPTEDYKAWAETAKAALQAKYQPGQFKGPVIVCVWLYGGRGFMESRDWDNVQKCVGDALADAGILPSPGTDKEGNEREGTDDVRAIKGWRTHYFTRQEHVDITGGAAGKVDTVNARLFVQIIDAQGVEPFRL